jgi:uncharacterized membrane protein YcaP (DUF421 family)
MTASVLRREQMASEGVTDDDLIGAARESRGLARLDDIDHAVLAASGGISIVLRAARGASGARADTRR